MSGNRPVAALAISAGLESVDGFDALVGANSVFAPLRVEAMSASGAGERLATEVASATGPGSTSNSSIDVTLIESGMVFTARANRSPFTSTVSDTVKVRLGVPACRGVTCHCQSVGDPGKTGCSEGVVATKS